MGTKQVNFHYKCIRSLSPSPVRNEKGDYFAVFEEFLTCTSPQLALKPNVALWYSWGQLLHNFHVQDPRPRQLTAHVHSELSAAKGRVTPGWLSIAATGEIPGRICWCKRSSLHCPETLWTYTSLKHGYWEGLKETGREKEGQKRRDTGWGVTRRMDRAR